MLTRSYKSIPEAERRGQDPVHHAGKVEDWPRHTPAAPGRRSRQVQERAAGQWRRHGVLRRSGACFLRRRLPPVKTRNTSATMQANFCMSISPCAIQELPAWRHIVRYACTETRGTDQGFYNKGRDSEV